MTASGANSRNSRSSVWLGRSGIAARIGQRRSTDANCNPGPGRIRRTPPGTRKRTMERRFRSTAGSLATALASFALAAGCGSSGSETVEQQTATAGAPEAPNQKEPLSPAEVRGRNLFVQHCGSCHTFDAAGTLGQVGPKLDDIAVNEAD